MMQNLVEGRARNWKSELRRVKRRNAGGRDDCRDEHFEIQIDT